MANLNEVTVQLKVQGEKEATAAMKRLNTEQGKLKTSVLDSARKIESINARWKEADRLLAKNTITTKAHQAAQKQLGRELAAVNGMYDSAGRLLTRKATQQLKDAQETTKAAQAQAQYTQNVEQLRMKLDPVYRATVQYEKSVQELNQAYAAGAISQDLYIDQMTRAEQNMNLMAQGGRGARRSMNNMNLAIQQGGYQFSDFAIQVQGGTSAFVAFSQQASQLVGILPMIAEDIGMTAGKAVALSSGLAIAIPLLTVAGNVFWEMSKEAREAEEELSNLEEGIKSLEESLKSWARTKEAVSAGVTVEELLGLDNIQAAMEDLSEARSRMDELQRLLDMRPSAAAGGAVSGVAMLEGFRSFFDTTSAEEYENAIREVIDAETLLANLRRKQGEEQFSTFQGNIVVLQEQLALEQQIALTGANSSEVRNLQLEQEIASRKRSIDAQVESKEITIAQGIVLKNLVEETLRLEAANVRASNSGNILSDIFQEMSMDNILSQMDALNIKLGSAIFGAGTLTARLGRAFDAAVAAAERVQIQKDQQAARAEGFRFGSTRTDGEIGKTEAFFTGRLGFTNAPNTPSGVMRPAKVSGGGGGGGSSRPEVDYLAQLEKEAAFKRTLIGLSEEQAKQEERRNEIVKRLTKDGETLTEAQKKRIESLIQMEAGTRRLIEAEKERERMINTFENNIESAFMSVVDGSKTVEEAFKGMLRNMVLEIYKQQVAEPAAEAIGGLLNDAIGALFPNANGNVFSGGSRVTAYANGGVVNSPTYFPMTSGVGLMGEAGPEAIMPLKRGANGKLGVQVDGNAGNVTVNQYFNIAANGDDSVRRIVRSEAPRIAEQAKAAVVDAKRRGGAYGRSF